MAVEKLIDIIINHLKGLSEHPEALAYITDVDRKKYRTEVMRYVGTMTGLSQHTLETRLAGQSRFKAVTGSLTSLPQKTASASMTKGHNMSTTNI